MKGFLRDRTTPSTRVKMSPHVKEDMVGNTVGHWACAYVREGATGNIKDFNAKVTPSM